MTTRRHAVVHMMGAGAIVGIVAAVTLVATAGAAESAAGATTSRVSISSSGGQANGQSGEGHVSASGRYVAFYSESTNLVPGDTNGVSDAFLRDRVAGTTRRMSVGPGGLQGNERSFAEAISSDGRYVAFTSAASNLVARDTNGFTDLFVRDVQAGVTQLVSVDSAEQQGNADTINFATAISANGRYVVFSSNATNLVPGDTTAPFTVDVFLRDRVAGTTQRISLGAGGQELSGGSFAAGISADGRYAAFSSEAADAVPGDTNGSFDAFVRDVQAQATRRVSVGPGGQQGELDSFAEGISADGRFVIMTSGATNFVSGDTNGATDAFVRDRQAGVTQRVSLSTSGQQANESTFSASISADGRYVSMDSLASNLVNGDTNGVIDVFVRDRLAGVTKRASVSTNGTQAVRHSSASRISGDGRHVVFMSRASVSYLAIATTSRMSSPAMNPVTSADVVRETAVVEPQRSRPYMPGYGIRPADEGTGLLSWASVQPRLAGSHDYWVATTRPDGQPHVMPVWGVWDGSALWFSSGGRSRKIANITHDPRCVVTTDNARDPIIIEGVAEIVTDAELIARFVESSNAKYDVDYGLDFYDPAVNATVRIFPRTAFAILDADFAGSATRWTFSD